MFSKLGRFEIKDILGRGAMGEVYLGIDPVLGREVAIKTIISSALPEDQARQRFDREAKAAAVLNSPNIVTIHELGEDQGVLFIAMERLKGQDLEQLLLQKSLSLVEALEVLAQVCDGLDTAHRNHIIHRDIKPSNVMVMREGRKLLVKLMDFGVARLKDSAMTMAGTVVGTVNYIAPEYIRSGEPDARSDLFAVGVMLYECIAGRKPFEGGSASTILFKIVHDPPDPLDLSMLQGLSPVLRNMTEKALAKDPDERFQSAEEFALALRAAKDPVWNGKVEETTVRMKIRPTPAPEPPRGVASPADQTVAAPVPVLPVPGPEAVTPSAVSDPPEPLPEAARIITQEVVVPPAAKTVVLVQPKPAALPVSSPTKDLARNPATTSPAHPDEPHAYRTVAMPRPKVPERIPPIRPALPVHPHAEIEAAKARTQEFAIAPTPATAGQPPAAKTEILAQHEDVEPPRTATAKDTVRDSGVAASPVIGDESPASRTMAAPLSRTSERIPLLQPACPTPSPAAVVDAKASIPECVIPPGTPGMPEPSKAQDQIAATPGQGADPATGVAVPGMTPDATEGSSKDFRVLVLGLLALAILGGVAYYVIKAQAVPPPRIAPAAPSPEAPPATTPPVSIPPPQTAPPPESVQQASPPVSPKASTTRGKASSSKAPVKAKTPTPEPLTPEPAPAPPQATAPPPVQAIAPPPVTDPKAKRKSWIEESNRKRLNQEEHSRK